MQETGYIFGFTIGGIRIGISYPVVAQWAIMAVIIILVLYTKRRFALLPKGMQNWLEILVENINKLVRENMGEEYIGFAPFIGTIMIFLTFLNLLGLLGFRPPTADYSVALALAAISFVIIHATALGKNGIGGYLKGYAEPFLLMVPLNIIERLIVPVSLSLRLFGNILAGTMVMDLLYNGLKHISKIVHLKIPFMQTIIPIPFHVYFDLFDGVIQMFIFVMLTMIFVKTTTEH